MSTKRRLLLMLFVLCLPLQSTLTLAGIPCRSMLSITSTQAMPMAGDHNHAVMLAAQNRVVDHHDHGAKNGCEHCAHCPTCSLSTNINAFLVQPPFQTATPKTPPTTEALVSLILDTPQRPPQA